MFRKIFVLISLFCVIENSISNDSIGQPWVDVVPTPELTPSPIPIRTCQVVPVNNAYNRFASISSDRYDTLTNAGTMLNVSAANDTRSYTMGGALGLVEYRYHSIVFYWDLNLGSAGSTVDGVGKPLEVVVRHYNVNYAPEDASNHRDGWFLLSIRVNVVKGVASNKNFTSFAQKVRQISKTGTSCKLTGNDIRWFLQSPVRKKEYCYAASRLNPATGESSNSATMCVTLDADLPTISESQFFNSFGALRNQSGQAYSSKMILKTTSLNRPIGVFGPVVMTFSP